MTHSVETDTSLGCLLACSSTSSRTNQNHQHHHSILDTTELTDKLSSLSMTSNSNQVATNHSQTRTVTLPTISDENISLSNLDSEKCDRLSIEPMGVESKSSRPSFDCHTHSGELSLHLLGHSPRMNAGRPPKGTYRYSTDGADQGGNTRSGRTPNTDNLCFVTTYVHDSFRVNVAIAMNDSLLVSIFVLVRSW